MPEIQNRKSRHYHLYQIIHLHFKGKMNFLEEFFVPVCENYLRSYNKFSFAFGTSEISSLSIAILLNKNSIFLAQKKIFLPCERPKGLSFTPLDIKWQIREKALTGFNFALFPPVFPHNRHLFDLLWILQGEIVQFRPVFFKVI